MIRLLIDENFDHDILRGLLLRLPDLNVVTVQAVGLRGASDAELLESANAERRILLTHDVSTVPKFAYARARSGGRFAGVFVLPAAIPIGEAIEQLVVLVTCSHEDEWTDQVLYLPL